ncbi:MAG: cobalt-precorrin-5B (C(1))-methyltransferase CbiD [Synechococcaceae cyanobacterium]|nr:cobalt-precorrin-5B (C(1))-methyltransferase CbiD [Synechococcaceae cyanobacterium]
MHGYTLPVWLAAAARAALGTLLQEPFAPAPELELLSPPGRRPVPVRAAAPLADGWALGISRCDPGDGLDLTRGLEVWALLCWQPAPAAGADPQAWLALEAGEGVGVHAGSGEACLSDYARRLLEANLRPLLPPGRALRLRVVLPEGRRLAERTSNAAFGVVEGLALIGTRAETQAGADPDPLGRALAALAARAAAPAFGGDLVLVIGENGLDLAPRLGLSPSLLLKAGNWLGPLLVAAAERGVRRLLLFGYQGKLLKLAGGIFHTHHHLADGRAEVLTALAALEGLPTAVLAELHAAPTVEAALMGLEARSEATAERLRQRIAAAVETRAVAYLARHGVPEMAVGAVLFDRSRRLCACGPCGAGLLEAFRQAP